MKTKRSTFLPLLLLVYLAVMSVIGWKGYRSGVFSALYYFGSIAATLVIIALLHFFLKKREQLRSEREADMRRANHSNTQKK